jgi:hypothetical protein
MCLTPTSLAERNCLLRQSRLITWCRGQIVSGKGTVCLDGPCLVSAVQVFVAGAWGSSPGVEVSHRGRNHVLLQAGFSDCLRSRWAHVLLSNLSGMLHYHCLMPSVVFGDLQGHGVVVDRVVVLHGLSVVLRDLRHSFLVVFGLLFEEHLQSVAHVLVRVEGGTLGLSVELIVVELSVMRLVLLVHREIHV